MPIQHTVVFRLIHPEGSVEEREFLATGHAVLTSIPGVEDFVIRRQVSDKSALTHQFSMSFVDEEAYAAYDAHPAHAAFVTERWLAEVAEFQEYDFVE